MKIKNFLLFTIGSSGDVFPMIALAENLQKKGYSTCFIAVEAFRKYSEEKGIPFLSLASEEEYLNAVRNPDIFHPYRGFSVVARTGIIPAIRRMFEIARNYDPSETAILSSGLCFGAKIAGEALGFAHIGIHLQPVVFRSLYDTPQMTPTSPSAGSPRFLKKLFYWITDNLIIDPILKKEINGLRKEQNLPPVKSFFGNYFFSNELNLALFPEWFAKKQMDWPDSTRQVGFPLYDRFQFGSDSSSDEDVFLNKPILFTAGTGNHHAKAFFEMAAEACLEKRWKAVFLSSVDENIPKNLPPNVIRKKFIPLSTNLPGFSLLVHHGGIGTLSQAIYHGIPQIILPQSHDQPDNAVRIRRLGIGDYLYPKQQNSKNLINAIEIVRDSGFIYKNCQFYSEKLQSEENSIELSTKYILEFLIQR
ncbi:MAG: glycosyltransferase [Leptospiraceae bacterium]|nr:glycosyltransferase [Leptospiraceae bacterium]